MVITKSTKSKKYVIVRFILINKNVIYQASIILSNERTTSIKEKNTKEHFFAVLYICKVICIFYHNHLKKLTANFLLIDSTLSIAKSTIKL